MTPTARPARSQQPTAELGRRGFLVGIGAALVGLAAPAIIRTPGLLMPVKAFIAEPTILAEWIVVPKAMSYVVKWLYVDDENGFRPYDEIARAA